MRRLIFISILTVVFYFQFFTSPLFAAFGVSPADLTYEYLSPEMVIEEEFLVSRSDLDKEASVSVETEMEKANDWFKFEPGVNFIIPKGKQSEILKVKISVPSDAEYKNYKGYINLKVIEGEKTAGVSIIGGVGVAVNLTVTKTEIARLFVRKLELPNVLRSEPLRLLISAENRGNKQASFDKVEIIIKDGQGNELGRSDDSSLDAIDPGGKKEVSAEFKNNLNPGDYFANVSVIFQKESIKTETLAFSVLEPVNMVQTEIKASNEIDNSWIFLLRIVLLSIIPVTVIWIIIRKKYVK